MGASVRPEPLSGDQILENVQAMRAQGASDNDVEAYLRQEGVQPDQPAARTPAPATPAAPDPMDSYGMRLATHVLNAAQGIPGMRAVEAALGALGSKATDHPMDYRTALGQLDEMTGNIGGKTSFGEKVLGSAPVLPFLPANPALAGGLLGASDQALDADPNESLLARGVKTAAGGAAGAVIGHLADHVVTAARAKLPGLAKSAYDVLANLVEQRSSEANPLYAKAIAEGMGNTNTPAIQRVLARPEVKGIVADLLQTDEFKGLAPHDPRVLDAVYKTLSDQAKSLQSKVPQAGQIADKAANMGRYALRQVKAVQQDLLDAMSGGTSLKGPMPSYRQAVNSYATNSRAVDAAQRGMDAVRAARITIPTARNVLKNTPDAFEAWAKTASPAERMAALDGIVGALRKAPMIRPAKVLGVPVLPVSTRVAENAPRLLRAVGSKTGEATLAGLLGLHAATTP